MLKTNWDKLYPIQRGCARDTKRYRHPTAMWAKRTACLSSLTKAIPGRQTAASSTKSPRSLTSRVCWQRERPLCSLVCNEKSLPGVSTLLPCNQGGDARCEFGVFSISSDSINVMFFHEPNQSSAPLHAFATCLYWARRMGRLCFSDRSWHVCKALAAIVLSKPLGFFCRTDHTFSIPLPHFKEMAPFLLDPNNSHADHSSMLEMVRMLLTLSMQLQRAAATAGGVSWPYTSPNAAALKTEARYHFFHTCRSFSLLLPLGGLYFFKKNLINKFIISPVTYISASWSVKRKNKPALDTSVNKEHTQDQRNKNANYCALCNTSLPSQVLWLS